MYYGPVFLKRSLAAPVLLLTAALVSAGCGKIENDPPRVGEERSAEFARSSDDLVRRLPVAPGVILVRDKVNDCSDAYLHDYNPACFRILTFETADPVYDALEFYRRFLDSEPEWINNSNRSSLFLSYENDDWLLQVSPQSNPEVFRACQSEPEGTDCLLIQARNEEGPLRRFTISMNGLLPEDEKISFP